MKDQNIESIYPLSPIQQGILFHCIYTPNSGVYIEHLLFTLHGNLNIDALRQAWQQIIQRHAVLRTLFVWEKQKKPLQIVRKKVDLPWDEHDWKELSSTEQTQRLEALLNADRIQGFQLDRAPLMRCILIRYTNKTYQLLWSLHHIILDGWCFPIILEEVRSYYQAYNQGQSCTLPSTSPYQDYIVWLQNQDYVKADAFWQRSLQGYKAPTPLVVERAGQRQPQQPSALRSTQEQALYLGTETTQALQFLARQYNLTAATLMQAAWAILLSRYSGELEVLFGVVVSGRSAKLSDIEKRVGLFTNTLPLRVLVPAQAQLIPWLQQLNQQQLEMQTYSYSSLVEIQKLSEVPSGIPLFASILSFGNYPIDSSVIQQWDPSLRIERLESFSQTHYPISVIIAGWNEDLYIKISYEHSHFDSDTILRMLGHIQTLLVAIATNPKQQLGRLPLLTTKEQQLLIEWNQTTTDYPSDQCIHQLFEAQVEQTPDAVAVVFEDQHLTYSELNTQANQLAHYLQQQGVGPNVLVGICLERSLEMVVSLLGILKAGGAYVPLDPTYPQERLNFMLCDAQISLLLTQQALVTQLPSASLPIVCLDADWQQAAQATDTPTSHLQPGHLAYVIYTSGSTGKPKGIAMGQAALVNLIHWQLQTTTTKNGSKTLQFAPISFDVSFQEIFSTWCAGGTLVLCPEVVRRDPEALLRILADTKVERLFLPFVALQQLAENAGQTAVLPTALREIITAGEQLQITPAIANWLAQLPDCQLQNQYGPSESHVVTAFTLTGDVSHWPLLPPIGRPIANCQIYLLDKTLEPVPIGVAGELCIGGVGLAQGYLNRPEQTQEKFIPNPFSPKSGDRLYKTGDLARYLPDGNLEFLGRIDHQVKIRGFRIETGEIEATLNQNPAVKDAVVTVNQKQSGEKHLVAYLVPQESPTSPQTSLVADVRQFLKQQLPDYMIPSAFALLEELPLTPSGKVDRKALPELEVNLARLHEYVPPQTSTQEIMARIFAEVLGITKVGIHDNFFELGGHSLLATQLVSRLQQVLEQYLPLKTLFENPTIAQLDQVLVQVPRVEGLPAPVPEIPLKMIVPVLNQRYQPFPLTDIQQAYWLGRNSAFDLGNIATHVYLEIDCESLDIDQLSQAWQRVINHHDMLRMVILPNGEQQVLEQVPLYHIEVLDLRGQSEQTISTQLEAIRHQMSHEILPAGEWPLFRVRVTHLADQRYRLHSSFDAIVADAWSMSMFWQQWLQLYQNLESSLPQLDLTFRDYVLAELSLKDTPQYRRSQQYWWNRLETLPPAPELPLVQQTATLDQPEFNCYQAELSAPDWQQLKARAKQANLTPSGILLAAFADLLAYWSKSSKFTINLTLFNRLPLHPQINDLVGDFTSLTLLEVNHADAVPFAQRAQRLQGQLWQDLDHRYVGGVEVQRELRRQRGSYQPFGVVFTSTLALDTLAEKGLPSKQQKILPLEQLGEIVYMVAQTPQVWLDHSVAEQNGALMLAWNVIDDLFPEGLVDEMFTSYYHWLQQLATSDAAWAQTAPQLLPPPQLTQRLQVNETHAPVSEETLHSLFVKQVQQRPEAIALITPKRTLTYQELYTEAYALGQQVQQLGATPNTLVAVLMEKGWEQIVAVLGILMAGAAYLPIDAALPQERQWSLLEQGEVKLVVTQAALTQRLALPDHLHCLVVGEQPQDIIDTPLEANVSSTNLAYVIFTSGSTGTPKGVMIDHRGAVNTIQDINQRFDIQPSDRMLAVSALNFDLSVYDIFGLLAAGGTLVMPDPEAAKDPAHWVELMTTHQVTLW
ncbi:non-ribosomal peptide synthetase, partial [Moorena sp. SIO3H5]|uniref:non-ribosomal peptide synthetase n=1 Tax=Moorena sp. SIO3H5 TaxID=2607834 RepID=UPI0013BC612B